MAAVLTKRVSWTWPTLVDQVREVVDIDPATGCWNWVRSVGNHGYGAIRIHSRTHMVHRAVLQAATGMVGEKALHSCDNRLCANPDHLRWGTNSDNIQDAISRDRFTSGRTGRKLTREVGLAIRAEYEAGGISQAALGEKYGVSRSHVNGIVNRRFWNEMEGQP